MKGSRGSILGSLARRYARALVNLATEAGQLGSYGTGLSLLQGAYDQGTDLSKILSDRFIPMAQRLEVASSLAQKLSLPPLLQNFFCLLVGKERAELLPNIAREYASFQDQIGGIVRVQVTVGQKEGSPAAEAIQKIMEKRLKKKVVVGMTEDRSLIGGMVLRVDNLVFDGSLKRELERIQGQLTEQPLTLH